MKMLIDGKLIVDGKSGAGAGGQKFSKQGAHDVVGAGTDRTCVIVRRQGERSPSEQTRKGAENKGNQTKSNHFIMRKLEARNGYKLLMDNGISVNQESKSAFLTKSRLGVV